MANPFLTYAGVLERSVHLAHLYTRSQPEVVGYQVWGHTSVNDAYGNPVGSGVGGAGSAALFQVNRGEFFRSPTLRRKGLAAIPENRKGTTQFAFDPDDYTGVAGVAGGLPLEEHWLCLRLQESRGGGLLNLAGDPAKPVLGPIYLVPPASAYGMPGPSFTVTGTAPTGTTSTAGLPPVYDEDLLLDTPRPMHLVFSSPLREFTLRNTSGNDMLVSFGPGQPMMTLLTGMDTSLFNGMTKEMVLACPVGGGATFSLHGVLGRG